MFGRVLNFDDILNLTQLTGFYMMASLNVSEIKNQTLPSTVFLLQITPSPFLSTGKN